MSTTQQDTPLAVVTGASTGIGWALARQFVDHGYDLVIAAESARFAELFVRRGLSIDFGGTGKGSYLLTIEILPGSSRPPVPVYSDGHYVDADASLRLYVTGAEIRQRLPEFVPGGRYTVRATLTLSVPGVSSSGEWSDAFVESIFPARERSHVFARELDFGPPRTPAKRHPVLWPR